MDGIFVGADIYRNSDIAWQKTIDASNGSRKIDIALTLDEVEEGFSLTAKTNTTTCTVSTESNKIIANNPQKAIENTQRKAMQWGDTIFNPTTLTINTSTIYLIQASTLGNLKRLLANELTTQLIKSHLEARPSFEKPKNKANFPTTDLDYTYNVANAQAETFYREHGCKRIDYCPEISKNQSSIRVMKTKHCIRYANGLCPKQTGKPTPPLFIENKHERFSLMFDCSNCLMEIFKI